MIHGSCFMYNFSAARKEQLELLYWYYQAMQIVKRIILLLHFKSVANCFIIYKVSINKDYAIS